MARYSDLSTTNRSAVMSRLAADYDTIGKDKYLSYISGTADIPEQYLSTPQAAAGAPTSAYNASTGMYNVGGGASITGSVGGATDIYGEPIAGTGTTTGTTDTGTGQTESQFSTDATRQNIYNMTAPTANMPNAPDIQSLLNMNYTVGNPYTRGLLERGLQQGQVPWMLTPEGQQAEEARRIATLEQAVVPQAQAAMGTALTDVQRQMQKAGKLSSSATTLGMMRTSEQYAADIAGKMAAGTLDIYGQIDTAYAGEATRQLQGSLAQLESETGLKSSAINAAVNMYGIQATAATAEMQTWAEQQIAQIQADVTLSAQEKDAYIAQINNAASERIAKVQSDTAKQIATENNKTALTIAIKEIGGMEKRLGMQLTEDQAKRLQDVYMFNVTNLDESGRPRWVAELESSEFTESEKIRIASDRLTEERRQFNISTAEGRRQFYANLQSLADDRGSQRYMFDQQMLFNYKELQLGEDHWNENMKFQRTMYADENAAKRAEAQLARDIFNAQVRDADLTRWQNATQFRQTLDWQKEEFNLNDTQVRDLQRDVLAEQMRQFDVSQANDMVLAWATFNETCRQFEVSREFQQELAIAGLTIQQQTMTNQVMSDRVGLTIDFLNAVGSEGLTTGEGGQLEEIGLAIMDFITDDDDEEGNPGVDFAGVVTRLRNAGIAQPSIVSIEDLFKKYQAQHQKSNSVSPTNETEEQTNAYNPAETPEEGGEE